MKQLSNTLLNTQIAGGTPVVSTQIQAYGHPAASSDIIFNEYDWNYVWETSKGGAWACCASDGSFVITSGTGATTVRIASPNLDTTFTTWGASGTKGTFNAALAFCIAANPTSNEVIIAYLSGGHLYRQESTNYGASFGSAIDMGASLGVISGYLYTAGTVVRMAYTPTGDLAIIVGCSSVLESSPPRNVYVFYLGAYVRRSGTWGSPVILRSSFDEYKFTLGHIVYSAPSQSYFTPYFISYAIVLENMDIAYDGDWLITYTVSQTDPGGSGGYGYPISRGQIIYGLYYKVLGNGTYIAANVITDGGEVSLVETKAKISNLSQLSHFSPSTPSGYEELSMPILLTSSELIRTATIHPATHLHKIPSYPLILSLWTDSKVYLCELRRGTNITTATFNKAYTFNNDRPVKLCSNSTWLFAYNGDQIFMSYLPANWVIPTIGTGAGATVTPSNAIFNIKEQVNINQSSQLLVSYNNSDDYFDTPSSGALAALKKGSRVNLSLGYKVGGVDYTEEYARYFVGSWDYTREPNRSIFDLLCIDAWGLLEKYRFNRKINFNYLDATTTYSVYQLIEMLVKVIGGSLTYANKSSFMDSFKPVLEVSAGENAANVLRRLLFLVPDQIKFFGNDATIYYPQTTDTPVYYYSNPV